MSPNTASIDHEVVLALIETAPAALGILILLIILSVYRKDVRRLLPRVSSFELLGLKLSLIDLKTWAEAANQQRSGNVTDKQLRAALDRAQATGLVFQGAQVLWVDDHPENNSWERRALRGLGARLDIALSNEEARYRLKRGDYDLVLSDLGRDSGENPRDVITELPPSGGAPEVIYYVGAKKDTPTPEAFALTARPDELLNFITDALERRYYRSISD
jgi:CheY-like chemotaxis protein